MKDILIAEDDDISRKVLTRALTTMGYNVTACPNGIAVLQALEIIEGVDCVITDVCMPQMDGEELIKEVRSKPGYANLPIIVISSITDIERIFKLIDLGADNFLTKPFSAHELHDCLKSYSRSLNTL